MNFGFNLLSNYSPAEADWGIEESFQPRARYSTASDYSQPPPIRHSDFGYSSLRSPSAHKFPLSEPDYPYSPLQTLQPNTENFHKYIRKYLALNHNNAQIVEKFKYNLVISNLLDDTLVLSKNEQALSNLVQIKNTVDHELHLKLVKEFNFDGSELHITNKKYTLHYPLIYNRPSLLISTICCIIFLLKQNIKVNSNLPYSARVQMFKVLLIISTKIVKFKRAVLTIEATKSLRSLDDFMISNCRINKVLISNMITLKEYEMFSFLNKADESSQYSHMMKGHLNTILSCLLLNVKHSIRAILPLSNGTILEKYCEINNVPLGVIFDEEPATDAKLSLEGLTTKLNLFNSFRRFFICQLLTIHDSPHRNFLILKLFDAFNIEESALPFVGTSEKINKLETVFKLHTLTLDELYALNDKFNFLNKSKQTSDYVNDNVLTSSKNTFGADRREEEIFAPEAELNLNHLIHKLQNLTTSLKYFKKYSQSILDVDDVDEHDEKLSIFGLFGTELTSAMELFKTCSTDYLNEISLKYVALTSRGSSRSNSQRGSLNGNDPFSLKSFHTPSSTTTKKRYSLPNNAPNAQEAKSVSKTDKRHKRLSTGLKLGLLTVMEDPNGAASKSERNGIAGRILSYDGSYTPPTSRESYNEASLDALTKKHGLRNSIGRLSMNSVNSNVSGLSDLIASTQMTTDEDDGDISKTFSSGMDSQEMSKEELKKKLEESFTRIYSLQSENEVLKSKGNTETLEESVEDLMNGDPMAGVARDLAFLGDLEEKLTAKNIKTSV